jgi:hypothetical protein
MTLSPVYKLLFDLTGIAIDNCNIIYYKYLPLPGLKTTLQYGGLIQHKIIFLHKNSWSPMQKADINKSRIRTKEKAVPFFKETAS